eukprot:TRINITY_DN7415_c0_g1_i6.p1 TRINITY_DN7415_c0_g1~~TRINITY_DN7415_c0_g1_i6.p1  ORF type:complete len:385 (+),score=61.72 TRINITY_DN7415_c0_g1_i6:437-1591(+)
MPKVVCLLSRFNFIEERQRRTRQQRQANNPLGRIRFRFDNSLKKQSREEVIYGSKDLEEKITHMDTTFEMLQKTNRLRKKIESHIPTIQKNLNNPTQLFEGFAPRHSYLMKPQLFYDSDLSRVEYTGVDVQEEPNVPRPQRGISAPKKDRWVRTRPRIETSIESMKCETEVSPTRSTFSSRAKINQKSNDKQPLQRHLLRSVLQPPVQLSMEEKKEIKQIFEEKWNKVKASVDSNVSIYEKRIQKISTPSRRGQTEYLVSSMRDAMLKKEMLSKAAPLMKQTMNQFMVERARRCASVDQSYDPNVSVLKGHSQQKKTTQRKMMLNRLSKVVVRPERQFNNTSSMEIEFYEKKMSEMKRKQMEAPDMSVFVTDEAFRNLISPIFL